MKFVFWQNIISIHQSAFIKSLSQNNDVTLIVEKELDKSRKNELWNIPDMGKVKVILNPSNPEIESYFKDKNICHVFSGINAFPMVFKAFKIAIKKNANITVMAEPYDWRGYKGFLRRIKYTILFAKYGSQINHFFTTGNHGIRVFHQSGFPLIKLHQWGYFTENNLDLTLTENQKPTIIFVGKIDGRKNILSLVNTLKPFQESINSFFIVGIGPLVKALKESIKDYPKFHYFGSLTNEETKTLINKSDLLVLPSLFDGWGAVVNEALQQGTRVLCSDACGAEILLDGKLRGGKFSLKEKNSFYKELKKWIDKGALSIEPRNEIRNWAERHISGKIAAKYFEKIIQGKNITAPWLN